MNLPLVTPVGGPLFDLGDPAALDGASVFVEFVVSLLDSDGVPATATLSAALPVSLGGVDTWCDGGAAGTDALDYVDGVDLVVGSAGTPEDMALLKTASLPLSAAGPPNITSSLNTRSESALGPKCHTGPSCDRLPESESPASPGHAQSAHPANTRRIDSGADRESGGGGGGDGRSVEGGLLTLVLRGKDALPAGSTLAVEDLVTLHVTGDTLYAQVLRAMGGPSGGFKVCVFPSAAAVCFVAMCAWFCRRTSLC